MKLFVAATIIVCTIFLFGCKTKAKTTKQIDYTQFYDTIKVPVSYQQDSAQVIVKPIITSDSLFAEDDETVDYDLFYAEQKDSLLFLSVRSFYGCDKMDFDLYMSNIALKTYPVRLQCRLSKTKSSGCSEKLAIYTLAFDIKPLLKQYGEAHIMLRGSNQVAHVKGVGK
jgi:hypothetical protein